MSKARVRKSWTYIKYQHNPNADNVEVYPKTTYRTGPYIPYQRCEVCGAMTELGKRCEYDK